jgi:hypothetical protein
MEVLAEERAAKRLSAPVTIVGDICGQFYDLRELFFVRGPPSETNHRFMGDGFNSLETFLYFLSQ